MYAIISFMFIVGLVTTIVVCSILLMIIMDMFRGRTNRKYKYRR